jgi:hypothetical protein|tara:strand:- start:793 stop:1008 length:216 start_codon:yes stop_codon:yes gene_type:complete
MKKKKNKPTLKDLSRALGGAMMQIEQLKSHVFNGDKALDEYIKMKGDKEDFIKFLEKNYKDDTDKEKAEDK